VDRGRLDARGVDGGPTATNGGWKTPGPLDATSCMNCAPAAYQWDVYRVRIQAGRTNVGVPLWVSEWTTRDDGRLQTVTSR